MAFRVICKSYLDILMVQRLFHFLEFRLHHLMQVQKLSSNNLTLYLEDTKASVTATGLEPRTT